MCNIDMKRFLLLFSKVHRGHLRLNPPLADGKRVQKSDGDNPNACSSSIPRSVAERDGVIRVSMIVVIFSRVRNLVPAEMPISKSAQHILYMLAEKKELTIEQDDP